MRLTSDNICVVANSDDKIEVDSDSDKSRFIIGFTEAIIKNTKTSFIDAFVAGKKMMKKTLFILQV